MGDNIGVGPKSGNSEEYTRLGLAPFCSYFTKEKRESHIWTESKLEERQIRNLEFFPRSLEITVGGEKVVLCHFANDVRCDFTERSTWSYQKSFPKGHAYSQFLYTNSSEQIQEIEQMIHKYGENNPKSFGYLSAREEPLFQGKTVDNFDSIIQGHIHFRMFEKSEKTKFYSI